jgi:hypothetical protein
MMPINLRLAHGCHCNRPTLEGIRNAGFEVTELQHDTLKHTPPFVRPLIVGAAEASAQSPGQSADQVVYSSTISAVEEAEADHLIGVLGVAEQV